MTASEKLRALDEAMNDGHPILGTMNFYFGPGARTLVGRESVLQYEAAAVYIRALSLIADVVEAAERVLALETREGNWEGPEYWQGLGEAVATIRDPLTALREHLGEKVMSDDLPYGSGPTR